MWIKPPFERAKHQNAAGGGYSEVLRGRNKEQCRRSKEGNATMFLKEVDFAKQKTEDC